MAAESEPKSEGPFVYGYHYSREPSEADGASEAGSSSGAPMTCPDFRGTGSVLLLVSSRTCLKCGGTGKLTASQPPNPEPAATDEAIEQYVVTCTTYTYYDSSGRVVAEDRW